MRKKYIRNGITLLLVMSLMMGCNKIDNPEKKVTESNSTKETTNTGANETDSSDETSEVQTEVLKEPPTEPTTEVTTEPVTEKPTEEATKEPETTKATEATTEKATEKKTDATTKATTKAPTTKATTQASTKAPTTQATTKATEAATEAPTQQMYEVYYYDKNAEWKTADGYTYYGGIFKTMRSYPATGLTDTFYNDRTGEYCVYEYYEDSGLTLEEARQAVLDGFNANRVKQGWEPVYMTFGNKNHDGNPKRTNNLTENAQNWANFMAENNYFYHAGTYTYIFDPDAPDNPYCDVFVNEAIGKRKAYPFLDYSTCYSLGGSLAVHNQRFNDDYCRENGYALLEEIGIGVAIKNNVTYVCIQSVND